MMCYAIAANTGHSVHIALSSVPEHCPGQQMYGQVLVPTQWHEVVPDAA